MLSIIKINDLNSIHQINDCLVISESLFGKGYHNNEYFKINSNKIQLLAQKNFIIVGFLTAFYLDINKVQLDCVAITEKWQKKKK